MSNEEKAKLKREITKRWAVVSRDIESKEGAQLEYILQEAGLLARPRRRLAKIENLEAAIFDHEDIIDARNHTMAEANEERKSE